jgi:uncharacterized membrane protein YphA (DoxX/SURF4 family)
MGKAKTIVVWVLSILCSLGFLFAGGAKLIDPVKQGEQFAELGYPDWFRVLIAVLEIAGGLLLLLPRFAWIGSGMLAVIMVGAVVSVVRVGAPANAIPAAVFLVILLFITYARWPRSVSKST